MVTTSFAALVFLLSFFHWLSKLLSLFCPQVCGGHSNISLNGSCPDSVCGGASCRDDEGNRVCGGDGCNGTVSASLDALNHAKIAAENLNNAKVELQGVAKKVRN